MSDDYGKWDQTAYTKQVAAFASRLDIHNSPVRDYISDPGYSFPHSGTHDPNFYSLVRRKQFEIKLLCFSKGDQISLHDHPNMTGVSACLAGAVLIDSYRLVSSDSASRTALLKRLGIRRLNTNDVSTLTAKSRNIHRLEARERSWLIDIFTPAYDAHIRSGTTWYGFSPHDFETSTPTVTASILNR